MQTEMAKFDDAASNENSESAKTSNNLEVSIMMYGKICKSITIRQFYTVGRFKGSRRHQMSSSTWQQLGRYRLP